MGILASRRRAGMPGRRHTAEQIIRKLREAEVAPSKGATVAEACKHLEVTEKTGHRWRKEYGGLKVGRPGASSWGSLEQPSDPSAESVRMKHGW
jgi:transposase-like protein